MRSSLTRSFSGVRAVARKSRSSPPGPPMGSSYPGRPTLLQRCCQLFSHSSAWSTDFLALVGGFCRFIGDVTDLIAQTNSKRTRSPHQATVRWNGFKSSNRLGNVDRANLLAGESNHLSEIAGVHKLHGNRTKHRA